VGKSWQANLWWLVVAMTLAQQLLAWLLGSSNTPTLFCWNRISSKTLMHWKCLDPSFAMLSISTSCWLLNSNWSKFHVHFLFIVMMNGVLFFNESNVFLVISLNYPSVIIILTWPFFWGKTLKCFQYKLKQTPNLSIKRLSWMRGWETFQKEWAKLIVQKESH
jgi:hypothetical protein